MKKAIARAQNQADEYHSSVKQAAALNSGMGTTAANAADELVANVAAIGSSRTTHQTSYHGALNFMPTSLNSSSF